MNASHPKAAVYVRMSTDEQQYSILNQLDSIREYAAAHDIEIVKTFADEGRSGLTIEGRTGLRNLIDEVNGGQPGFNCVLVYDVSRWGRFQDADESAYYEFLCRRAGISVIYCAEHFQNDGSPVATIIKGLKRAMAGEYSRELSSKVFQGQCRLIQKGYRPGAPGLYGLRRVLVDASGKVKGELRAGERKCIQNDRVILRPGNDDECTVVNEVFRLFVHERRGETSIAETLNERQVPHPSGRPWTGQVVHHLLTSEIYVGYIVYYRTSCKLGQKRIKIPAEKWIRSERCFPPIVPEELFAAAQSIIIERAKGWSDEEILAHLRTIYQEHGALTKKLIELHTGPSFDVIGDRFGSVAAAYELIGYGPHLLRCLKLRLARILQSEVDTFVAAAGAPDPNGLSYGEKDASCAIGALRLRFQVLRCHRIRTGDYRWRPTSVDSATTDLVVLIRMDTDNKARLDYYTLPSFELRTAPALTPNNGAFLDGYRCSSLEWLHSMIRETHIPQISYEL